MHHRTLGRNADRILGLKGRRNLVVLAVVEVQKVEPVVHRGKRLLGRSNLLPQLGCRQRVGLGAFVDIIVDLLALVSPVPSVSVATKIQPDLLAGDSACTAAHRWHCGLS